MVRVTAHDDMIGVVAVITLDADIAAQKSDVGFIVTLCARGLRAGKAAIHRHTIL